MTKQKHNRSPDKKSQKDRIRELTEKLEEGVKAVFESDRYKEYLQCMSKFHKVPCLAYTYSFNKIKESSNFCNTLPDTFLVMI